MGARLEKAIHDLAKLEPSAVCMNSGVIFNREQDSYILPYLNRKFLVHHSSGKIEAPWGQGEEIPPQLHILLLHYLIHADGIALSGKWITPRDHPEGLLYGEGDWLEDIHPLLHDFGSLINHFKESAGSLGATATHMGNYSLLFQPLPKVPLVFVSWSDSEKFSFASNVLYDEMVLHYLPKEDCALLPRLIIQELLSLEPPEIK